MISVEPCTPVKIPKLKLILIAGGSLLPLQAAPPTGAITRHVWTGVSGDTLSSLRALGSFPNTPSLSNTLTSFSAPSNWADSYGTRVFGWVHAPVTGAYRISIHSDDHSELWLGTNESPDTKRLIASVTGWTNVGEWTKFPQQKSASITLQAGQFYYIEALQKEGGGGDNLGVGWEYPGQTLTYIPGNRLSIWQNLAPRGVADTAYVPVGGSTIVRVLDNDVDPNGTSDLHLSSLTIITPPTRGTAQINAASGTISYTDTGTGSGTDTLVYQISDLAGSTGTGTVTLEITNQLRLPLASSLMPADPPPQTIAATNAFPTISFSSPVAIRTPPGEVNRLFIVEQGGDIEVIPNLAVPALAAQPFIALNSIVNPRSDEDFVSGGEEGLLGLAFHPNYAANRRFFVYYTVNISGNRHQRLSEFAASVANPNLADPASEKVILQLRDEAGNHNGGDVHFGPDGYLYVSLGDEGNQDDDLNNSQLITKDFWSGIIRIDINVNPDDFDNPSNPNLRPNAHSGIFFQSGNPRYKVPIDNPWVGATTFNGSAVTATSVRTEFFAVGLRNPWRFSFDSLTGNLWCGDVGGGAWEEINQIVKGGNYGWAFREGNDDGPKWNQRPGNWPGALPPLYAYAHGSDQFQGNSVTGGVIYRGTGIPSLTGKYIFADYSSSNIWALNPSAVPVTVERITGEGGIAGFGTDPSNGDVLIADLNGQIRRLIGQSLDSNFPGTLAATGLFSDVPTLTPSTGLIEYQVNLPFWSDHAKKRRWFGLPDMISNIGYQREGSWDTPAGMIWVKHFEMEMTRGNPATSKRLETRVFVRNSAGAYGVSYRWNTQGTSATLANGAGEEFDLAITDNGSITTQRWRIPSRAECMTCHSPQAGHSLSFDTRQLNRPGQIRTSSGNFLQLLSNTGYLAGLTESPSLIARHLGPDETDYSLEARARAYLHVNCSYCHKPGGTAPTHFDARVETPLFLAQVINASASSGGLHPADRLLVPGQEQRSIIVHRAAARNSYSRMPPIGSNVIDVAGIDLLKNWIQSELPFRESFQAWQTRTLGSRPPADQAAGADPDGDGRINQREFLELTQPLVADPGASALPLVSQGTFKLTLPHLAGRSMFVETSTNLSTWEHWQIEGNNGLERASGFPFTLETPVADDPRFFRVKIHER